MRITEHPIYQQDIDLVANGLDLNQLDGKSVLITGVTGLIGSAIVDLCLAHNDRGGKISIYAASRNLSAIRERFGTSKWLIPVQYDALKPIHFDFHVDYIIHAASNATPDAYVSYPVDTMLANISGIRELLMFAAKTGAEHTVYVSSSEVYGTIAQSKALTEEQQGYIDPLSVRSSYSMGKRASETMCVACASQYGCNVSIVRPGHIYGPTCSASDRRISSDFARKAARGENLIMKSAGTQVRSYCHCLDCASAILFVLLHGQNEMPYNISNSNSVISIRQMAEYLAQAGNVELVFSLPTDAEKKAFNPMENASLDSERLEALGWKGCFDAETGLNHTVLILGDILEVRK